MICGECGKPEALCVCASVAPKANRHAVLFFQHPQEPDKELGSARLGHRALTNSVLKIGLSVSNLKKALGRDDALPAKWAVLYLGSGVKGLAERPGGFLKPGLYPVKKDGELLSDAESAEILRNLDGIILLDGTWSQAKTLWWRNSWLLKCRRLILVPRKKSLYEELRKEPRRECLSTIETTAEVLDALGEDPAIGEHLRSLFRELLAKYRENRPARKAVDRRRR